MMLMLVGTLPSEREDEFPTEVLAIRFFESEDGPAHVKQLAWLNIRKRYPADILERCGRGGKNIDWTVYEPRTKRGGWPHWLGPSAYYE